MQKIEGKELNDEIHEDTKKIDLILQEVRGLRAELETIKREKN